MRSTHVDPWENITTHNRGTEPRELATEQLELVADGSVTESALKLMGEILSNVSKTRSVTRSLRDIDHSMAESA